MYQSQTNRSKNGGGNISLKEDTNYLGIICSAVCILILIAILISQSKAEQVAYVPNEEMNELEIFDKTLSTRSEVQFEMDPVNEKKEYRIFLNGLYDVDCTTITTTTTTVTAAATTATTTATNTTEAIEPSIAVYAQNEETNVEDKTTSCCATEVNESVSLSLSVEVENTYKYYTEQDAIDIAKVLYRECGGVSSKTEQACVAWAILNMVDTSQLTIHQNIRVPRRYAFYSETTVYPDMLELAYDVLERWSREKDGETDIGRVLPKDYLYFVGYGGHNHFRNNYSGDYSIWDYSLPSPYDT